MTTKLNIFVDSGSIVFLQRFIVTYVVSYLVSLTNYFPVEC